jgi:hypothetical protein
MENDSAYAPSFNYYCNFNYYLANKSDYYIGSVRFDNLKSTYVLKL